jgi:hypothetical protein
MAIDIQPAEKPEFLIGRYEKAASRASYTKALAWHTANPFNYFFD